MQNFLQQVFQNKSSSVSSGGSRPTVAYSRVDTDEAQQLSSELLQEEVEEEEEEELELFAGSVNLHDDNAPGEHNNNKNNAAASAGGVSIARVSDKRTEAIEMRDLEVGGLTSRVRRRTDEDDDDEMGSWQQAKVVVSEHNTSSSVSSSSSSAGLVGGAGAGGGGGGGLGSPVSCSRKCRSKLQAFWKGWRGSTWWKKALSIMALLFISYATWFYFDGEDFFVIIANEEYTPHEVWRKITRMDANDPPESLRGRLPGVDYVYISHFAPLSSRKEGMTSILNGLGIDNYEFCDDWTRDRVLAEKDGIVKDRTFTDAVHLKMGAKVKVAKIGGIPCYKDHRVKEESVTKPLLGRVANLMQHLSIYERAVAAGHQSILVLEDDTVFVPHFRPRFTRMMEEVPEGYDIVFVGACLRKHAPYEDSVQISPLLHQIRLHRCANSYVISRNAMEKILAAKPDVALRNIDPFLEFHMGDLIPNVYWTEPTLALEGTKSFNPWYSSQRSRFSCLVSKC